MTTYYKILAPGRRPPHVWTPVYPPPGHATRRLKGPLVMCFRGYHILRQQDISTWIRNYGADVEVWTIRPVIKPLKSYSWDNKVLCRQVMLVRCLGIWTKGMKGKLRAEALRYATNYQQGRFILRLLAEQRKKKALRRR